MISRTTLITLLAASLPLIACSDDKDWDQEVILQLFKVGAPSVGQVKVEATQGGQTNHVLLGDAIFGSCDTNSVRIIPKGGETIRIKLTWSGGNHSFEVALPAAAPIKVVLGWGQDLRPGGCAPTSSPDGGVKPDGPNFPTGHACSNPSQCTGGLCLASYRAGDKDVPLPGGYCSRDCSTTKCFDWESCYVNKDNLGKVLSQVCLKNCKLMTECRESEGYSCSPGDVCVPK